MAQESVTQEASYGAQHDEHAAKKNMLGPVLCWAVVFADIGTSVYYVPGVLYNTKGVGTLAGFFVFLTLSVFVLLTLKYTEVTHRFPQGGGVVTVAAQALNPWFGALGGMFILVDYFLTAAISCLSGMLYLGVVLPFVGTNALWVTISILVLLGLLNWIGISESAKVSLVGAVIAFVSDLAILFTVFTHISFAEFLALFPHMFANRTLTMETLLTGFAGSFLAFSGLESISQLSPVMKQPHKKVAGLAMLLVIITVGTTSPLLTMFSTLLLPKEANDPVLNAQIVSLLGGHWGNIALQTEVAVSASALLVFASNTAIIGAYHVFMALSRMEFLPEFILRRNKLRGTPHYSIALATGVPIIVLILVNGNINTLSDMYAFGLLGAFTLTCLGLDVVRYRDMKKARVAPTTLQDAIVTDHSSRGHLSEEAAVLSQVEAQERASSETADSLQSIHTEVPLSLAETNSTWFKVKFSLGVLTTFLVGIAWSTNLVAKPLATAFGGGIALFGMVLAYVNHARNQRQGRVAVPVVVTRIEERMPEAVLAILTPKNGHNAAVIHAAVHGAETEARRPVMFLYLSEDKPRPTVPRMMEIVDPYLEDQQAKEIFAKAEGLSLKAKLPNRRYVYLQGTPEITPEIIGQIWRFVHPYDTVLSLQEEEGMKDINPDRIRYEITPEGKVAHLLKTW